MITPIIGDGRVVRPGGGPLPAHQVSPGHPAAVPGSRATPPKGIPAW